MNINTPAIGDRVRMSLTIIDDVVGKLIEVVPGGYVIEIEKDDRLKGVKKGQRLTLQQSALVEFYR